MKIGIISDTHIPARAKDLPPEIYKDFKGVDLIIHAGDLVELDVLNKLNTLSKQVEAVSGNMDDQRVSNILPKKKIIKLGMYKLGLIHGWGPPDKLIDLVKDEFHKDNVDIIVFGHSHYPINEKKDDILFFNPGSPTDKIFSPYNSYGMLEINDEIKARIIRL